MKLSIGIVGLPNVGKSTLFNALTKKGVPAENYPFCTIDPSVGVVAVPDERLDNLAKISNSIKTVPAVVEFVDIAGLVKGASKGEGMGNAFLSHIREVDAIGEVVRLFESGDITHVEGNVHPLRDAEIINTELALADLSTIEKRINNLQKDVRKGDKDAIKEQEVLERAQKITNDSLLLSSQTWTDEERLMLRKLGLTIY
jgi:GTP-binding protein YchF